MVVNYNLKKIKELYRKCNGNIDTYRRPIMKELLTITNKDNFKAVKLYNRLQKKDWRGFRKIINKLEMKYTIGADPRTITEIGDIAGDQLREVWGTTIKNNQ